MTTIRIVANYYEAPSFSPEQPVDQWIRFNQTIANASKNLQMLQMKEQEKIQKNLSLCLERVREWHRRATSKVQKTSNGYVNRHNRKRICKKCIDSQHRIKINDCEQKFPKRKPHNKSQLMNKPSFILEVLSGLDDRDFQLRRQNQAILKRLERLERQVKRSKYSRNLKKERSSSSS